MKLFSSMKLYSGSDEYIKHLINKLYQSEVIQMIQKIRALEHFSKTQVSLKE